MTRTDLINRLVEKNDYKTYLEIGIQNSAKNFDKINCLLKIGVDPEPRFFSKPKPGILFYKITSDEFFKQNKETFDICFIDGLHESGQVFRDILNCLNVLNKGGVIVCHDMSPKTENAQKIPRVQQEWNGDCWKAFVRLRGYRKDLSMFVVDTDQGCGVIKRGKQEIIKAPSELTWQGLVENRKQWLNLISIPQFISQ